MTCAGMFIPYSSVSFPFSLSLSLSLLSSFSLTSLAFLQIAEVESIACIISLGLPTSGLHFTWEVCGLALQGSMCCFCRACTPVITDSQASIIELTQVGIIETYKLNECPIDLLFSSASGQSLPCC